MKKRIRDYGIRIGDHPAGALNKLTDVPGVRVGHYTVDTEEHKTGVTVILPCEENIFASRLTAAAFVHNGFGKTAGIPQIEELGTLESPIALTNTRTWERSMTRWWIIWWSSVKGTAWSSPP